jgi:yecA family protein
LEQNIEHEILEVALRQCGASWDAAQTHGLLSGQLATTGVPAGPEWLLQVLQGADEGKAEYGECRELLDSLYQSTYWQLCERLSEFQPLLPSDEDDLNVRTVALSHWCEGFLHGLVSKQHGDVLKERLGNEPLSDIIKDMLQITRAAPDFEEDDEKNDVSYSELVEYLRVATQLCYEELADLRQPKSVTG